MTTYLVRGTGAGFNPDTGGVNWQNYPTMTWIFPDAATSFSYELTGETLNGMPVVSLDPEVYSARVDVWNYDRAQFADATITIGRIYWSGTATDVLVIWRDYGASDAAYIFEIGGTELPFFATYVSFQNWWQNDVTGFGASTGALAAGVQIPLAVFNIQNQLENDYITGSEEADAFYPGTGNDSVAGRGGDDTLAGGEGNDTLNGDSGDDQISGGPGDDRIDGGWGRDYMVDEAGDDFISGGGDDDTIVMGPGVDTLSGGAGVDTVIADLTGIPAGTFTAEIDLSQSRAVVTADANVEETLYQFENATLIGAVDARMIGNHDNNRLQSDAGADTLDGGSGWDVLLAGDGVDSLIGGDGDDVLDGGAGADVLDGGDGEDTVSYESATRSVRVDLQNPSINYNDAAGDTFIDVEIFQTGGTIDQLRGDAAANEFYTGGLSDRLYGRAGDDLLFGEAGADAFYGGLGADVMTGGDDAGRRDRYIYFAMSESGVGDGNRDVITDFVAGEDRIELGRLDADVTRGFKQGFDFVGDAGLSGVAGELAYAHEGGNTIVQADVDGDGAADFEIELMGVMDLTESDFLI